MFKAAKAIIRNKDLYYLQLRDNDNSIPYPNKWSFFGGRLYSNEDPKTGLCREIVEELMYSPNKPKEVYRWYNKETNTLIIYFLIELSKKKFQVKEGQKGSWIKKIDLDKISIAPDVQAVISFL